MIILYTKPDCSHCDNAKKYLEEQNIAYQPINVMDDANALQFLREKGHRSVPQLYVGDTLLFEGGNSKLHQLGAERVKEMVSSIESAHA